MRFRKGATLDTSQVRDVRGAGHRRHGSDRHARRGWRHRRCDPHRDPAAGERRRWRWRPLARRRPEQQLRRRDRRQLGARERVPDRRGREPVAGLPHRRRRQLGAGLLVGHRAGLHRSADDVLHRSGEHGVRHRVVGGRTVLLPGRQQRVHRPRVLRRARVAVRRARWAVRGGLRHRARVRAPRAEPARYQRACAAGPLDRPDERVRAAGAAGRLLRGRLGRARGGHRLHRAADRRRHRARARRRGRGRRRPHPAGDTRARRSRSVDPRLRRATATLVQPRLHHRRPEPLRHVRGLGDNRRPIRSSCRQNLQSVEVAGVEAVGETDRQAGDTPGHEVDDALVAFEHPADPQRG